MERERDRVRETERERERERERGRGKLYWSCYYGHQLQPLLWLYM